MKKSNAITIGLLWLLLLLLLVVSTPQLIDTKATSNENSISLFEKVPLTNSEINAAFPNLPTAEELYEEGSCITVDLRYSGKQVASLDDSLPDPNSWADIDVALWIINCTRDSPDWRNGGIISNTEIWLQYNSSVWVMVPQKYLAVSNDQNSMQQTETTWALGLYTDPNDIAHGAPEGVENLVTLLDRTGVLVTE